MKDSTGVQVAVSCASKVNRAKFLSSPSDFGICMHCLSVKSAFGGVLERCGWVGIRFVCYTIGS